MTIEVSLIGISLRLLLILALLVALVLIYRDGYPLLAVLAAGYTALCLSALGSPQPMAVLWRQGRWQFALPGRDWCEVVIEPPCYCFPLLVFLRWRHTVGGRTYLLCLWPDSGEATAMRRLRRRLQLTSG